MTTPRTRHWALLFAHAGLGMAFGFVLRPVISTEILDAGHSNGWLGVATVVFALPPLALAIPAGRLVDRTGERPWLVGGSVAYLGATILLLVATSLARSGTQGALALAVFLAASAVLGLGGLATVLGQQTWVMHAAARSRPDYWFGLYTFAISLGQLAAPAVLLLPGAPAGGTLATVPIAWVMVAASIAMLLASFGVPSHRRRGPDAHSTAPRPAPSPAPRRADADSMFTASARLLRRRGVVRALVASSLVLASVDVLVAYLPLLTRERGLDASWIGGLLMARALAAMGSRLFLSRLTALAGRRRVMVTGASVAAASLVVAAMPVPAWALVLCLLAYGFAAGTVQPLTMSWMAVITPAGERGHITSLRVVGNRAGQSLVPLVVAGVSVVGGGALAFAVTGVSLALSAVASSTAPNDEAARD